ncbi:hypothetical protein JW930_07455 [Candidatus Woesearchaeota archaeon]|nr:hypothetical protein [Candidatus Woesearchaeota archaeon]
MTSLADRFRKTREKVKEEIGFHTGTTADPQKNIDAVSITNEEGLRQLGLLIKAVQSHSDMLHGHVKLFAGNQEVYAMLEEMRGIVEEALSELSNKEAAVGETVNNQERLFLEELNAHLDAERQRQAEEKRKQEEAEKEAEIQELNVHLDAERQRQAEEKRKQEEAEESKHLDFKNVIQGLVKVFQELKNILNKEVQEIDEEYRGIRWEESTDIEKINLDLTRLHNAVSILYNGLQGQREVRLIGKKIHESSKTIIAQPYFKDSKKLIERVRTISRAFDWLENSLGRLILSEDHILKRLAESMSKLLEIQEKIKEFLQRKERKYPQYQELQQKIETEITSIQQLQNQVKDLVDNNLNMIKKRQQNEEGYLLQQKQDLKNLRNVAKEFSNKLGTIFKDMEGMVREGEDIDWDKADKNTIITPYVQKSYPKIQEIFDILGGQGGLSQEIQELAKGVRFEAEINRSLKNDFEEKNKVIDNIYENIRQIVAAINRIIAEIQTSIPKEEAEASTQPQSAAADQPPTSPPPSSNHPPGPTTTV